MEGGRGSSSRVRHVEREEGGEGDWVGLGVWGDGGRSGECIVSYLLMWAATTGDFCGTPLPPSLQARTHGSLRTRTTRVKLPENESPFAVHAESQLDPGKVGGLREFSLWNPSTEY